MNKTTPKRILIVFVLILLSAFAVWNFAKKSSYVDPQEAYAQASYAAKLGDQYYDKGKFDLAAQQYEKSLSIRKDRDNQFALATIYLRSGKKEQSMDIFRELSSGTDDVARSSRDTVRDLSAKQ